MLYRCLLPSPDAQRLFLARDDGRWSLPSVACGRGWPAEAVDDIRAAFGERYGVDAIVLKIVEWTQESVTCELEALSEAPWHDPELLADAEAAVVQLWREGGGWERHIAPWQHRGWFADAAAWIANRAGPVHALRQVKAAWNGSCVLRAETAAGTLFFKASPVRVPGEPAVIRALAVNWAQHVPAIVDADEERCWMLMRDVGGTAIDAGNPALLAEAARLMARMQIDQAAHVERWAAMGCPDRGLETMRSRLERLLVQIPSWLRKAGVLTAAEQSELVAFAPRADAMCVALAKFAVPPRSIHHEDFRDGNAHRTPAGAVVFIDWNDTVIAHPFFTLQRFLWFMQPPFGVPRHKIARGRADAGRRLLRDAYLAEFRRFAWPWRLRKAFELSSKLAPIYDELRFDRADAEEIIERGLTSEDIRNTRRLMDHLLEVCRDQ